MENQIEQYKSRSTEQLTLLCTEINNRLASKQVQISTTSLMKMLQDSEPITANPKEVMELMVKAARVLFGVSVDDEKVHPDLWRVSYAWIAERCIGLTVNDVRNAYNDAVIEKRQFVSITRDELTSPIMDYFKKKQMVLSERLKAEQTILESQQVEKDAQTFRNEAIELYKKCLESKKWTGTEFQAHSFARMFADSFSQDFKDEVWKDSKREYLKRKEAFTGQSDPFALPPPSPERIFSQKIVEEACKRGFLVVID